jgi:hypothetical protein
MTTATLIIRDSVNADGEAVLDMEGHLDPVTAVDGPPTPALIIASYIAANADRLCKEAIVWFGSHVN